MAVHRSAPRVGFAPSRSLHHVATGSARPHAPTPLDFSSRPARACTKLALPRRTALPCAFHPHDTDPPSKTALKLLLLSQADTDEPLWLSYYRDPPLCSRASTTSHACRILHGSPVHLTSPPHPFAPPALATAPNRLYRRAPPHRLQMQAVASSSSSRRTSHRPYFASTSIASSDLVRVTANTTSVKFTAPHQSFKGSRCSATRFSTKATFPIHVQGPNPVGFHVVELLTSHVRMK
ncbi:hypothetical protein ZWY2020_052145 [Hordeum vulgare]|nr:hypothetical protein ZWY2020_052145 [Hordeum vulgare]